MSKPRIWILYHFMHPDPVVSARLYDELAASLQENGWKVTAWPSNRAFRNPIEQYAPNESFKNVAYDRIKRPGFSQHSMIGRFVNSVWMITRWSLLRFKNEQPDVVLIGTDPAFGALAVFGLKAWSTNTKAVHWCFDLYPEAPIAQGMIQDHSSLTRALKSLLQRAYSKFDLIVDIGSCMRDRLDEYYHHKKSITLTPWALIETEKLPIIPLDVREALFESAQLGLLYSGSLGMAHSYTPFLALARKMLPESVRFHFSMGGPRVREFRESLSPADTNVGTSDIVEENLLEQRLAAADIHMLSLRSGWEGVVVPSKFFASLAMGRPVLFTGPERSSIASWIREHRIGWNLDPTNPEPVIRCLLEFNRQPEKLRALQQHCLDVYHAHFRKSLMLERWNIELRALLSPFT